MSETFNFQRFALLFKKSLLEQTLQIFGVFGIAIFATLIIYHPFNVEHINLGVQMDTFSSIFPIGTCCITFFLFNHFSENAKGYNYLLLPSSYFEKWAVGFTITALFAVIYLVFFRIIDTYHVNTLHKTIDFHTYVSDSYIQSIKEKIQILKFD